MKKNKSIPASNPARMAQATKLYEAVSRLALAAGEDTDELIDWLCGEHGGMFKLFENYFAPKKSICNTCQSLALAVMNDQVSYDTTPQTELNAGGEPVKNATYWKRQYNQAQERISELEKDAERHQKQLEACEKLHYQKGFEFGQRLAIPQTNAEPVAWRQTFINVDGKEYYEVSKERIGINDTPLYTTPQTNAEPVAIVYADDDGYWAEILPDISLMVGQLLYTTPQTGYIKFPTMLRKMWTGAEVQAWLDKNPLYYTTPQTKPLGWISVKERLPEDGQTVAFVVDCQNEEWLHGRVLGGRYQGGAMPCFSVPGMGCLASHWMPLPEAPKEISQGQE